MNFNIFNASINTIYYPLVPTILLFHIQDPNHPWLRSTSLFVPFLIFALTQLARSCQRCQTPPNQTPKHISQPASSVRSQQFLRNRIEKSEKKEKSPTQEERKKVNHFCEARLLQPRRKRVPKSAPDSGGRKKSGRNYQIKKNGCLKLLIARQLPRKQANPLRWFVPFCWEWRRGGGGEGAARVFKSGYFVEISGEGTTGKVK